MARLSKLTERDLDGDQRAVWDALLANRGPSLDLIGPDGAMVGPFNSFVHVPELGRRLSSLGAHIRFGTSIERRLSELAICTVGAHFRSEFEFWAHGPMAVNHGISQEVVDALVEGRPPEFVRDDERVIHEIVSQLLTKHRVDADTFSEGKELLGERGLIELASTIGYYCLISMTLNLFEVELPAGSAENWPDA